MADHSDTEAEADFHRILGVQPDATMHEIRRAFRQQAMLNHPDRNPGDMGAERRFREILEAYKVALQAAERAAEPAGPGVEPAGKPPARPRRTATRQHGHRSRPSLNRVVGRYLLFALFTVGPMLLILLIIWANTTTDWLPGCCVE